MRSSIARRHFLQSAVSTFALAALAGKAQAAALRLVQAAIEGPIPANVEAGEPYRGANEQPVAGPGLPLPDLKPYDYVEEEYFISGMVAGQPYKTSLLVRKPRDPRKFSGLIGVETIHASGAIPFWGNKKEWMTGGHGWVAAASQLTALEDHVRKSNPKRYASLALPNVRPASASPMAAMAGGEQDKLSQEIMTQLGRLLKSNSRRGPFSGMRVRYLVMGGASQTGGTTLRYIEQSHAGARLAGGKPVYDGYYPAMAFPERPLAGGDAAVLHVVTEGDLMAFGSMGRPMAFRDDGDAPNDRYRHYQIPGDSHVGMRGVSDPLKVFSTLGNVINPGEHLSQFPAAEVMLPTLRRLIDWVMHGTLPPRIGRIEMAGGKIVRDEHGNAKGGLRSPWVDVPTVRYIASAPMAQGDNFFRRLIGLEEPFADDKLRALYGSKANYLAHFNAGIDAMLAGAWLRPDEAARLKAEEQARQILP